MRYILLILAIVLQLQNSYSMSADSVILTNIDPQTERLIYQKINSPSNQQPSYMLKFENYEHFKKYIYVNILCENSTDLFENIKTSCWTPNTTQYYTVFDLINMAPEKLMVAGKIVWLHKEIESYYNALNGMNEEKSLFYHEKNLALITTLDRDIFPYLNELKKYIRSDEGIRKQVLFIEDGEAKIKVDIVKSDIKKMDLKNGKIAICGSGVRPTLIGDQPSCLLLESLLINTIPYEPLRRPELINYEDTSPGGIDMKPEGLGGAV